MICDKCKKEKKEIFEFKNTPLKFCKNCFKEIFDKKIKKAIRGKIDIKKKLLVCSFSDLSTEIIIQKLNKIFYYKNIYIINILKSQTPKKQTNNQNIIYLTNTKILNITQITKLKTEYNIFIPITVEITNLILLNNLLLNKKNINLENIFPFSDITIEDIELYNSKYYKSKKKIITHNEKQLIEFFEIDEIKFYNSVNNELDELYQTHNGIIYSIFRSFDSYHKKEIF